MKCKSSIIKAKGSKAQGGIGMKVLVIPDVHLKPFMFQQAAALLRQGIAERAVCLMDIPDDWNKEYDCQLYEETYDEALRFAEQFPGDAVVLWEFRSKLFVASDGKRI